MNVDLLKPLLISCFYVLMLSMVGSCLFMIINEISSKKFHLKLAKQISKQILWMSILSFFSIIGFLIVKKNIYNFFEYSIWWCTILLILIFTGLYLKNKIKYFSIFVIGLGSLFINYNISLCMFYLLNKKELIVSLKYLQHFNKNLVFVFFILLILSLSIYSFWAKLYLLIRRKKDDFGRDYYKYAIQYISKWNIMFVAFLFFWGIKYFIEKTIPNIIFLIPSILCCIVAIILSYKTIITEIPLRYKGSIIFSLIFSICAFVLFFYTI